MLGSACVEMDLLSTSMASDLPEEDVDGDVTLLKIEEDVNQNMEPTEALQRMAVSKKRQNAKSFAALLKPYLKLVAVTPELGNLYEIIGSTPNVRMRLKLRSSHGYRFHPESLCMLQEYFNGNVLSDELLHRLIAILVQDCVKEDPVEDIWNILVNDFTNLIPRSQDENPMVLLTMEKVSLILMKFAHRIDYGPPIAKGELFLWQVNDPELLPAPVASMVMQDRSIRDRLAPLIWNLNSTIHPTIGNVLTIESALPTLLPPTIAVPIQDTTTAKTAPSSVKKQPVKANAKISSFFSVFKKNSLSAESMTGTMEFFQPFYPKPNMRVAPKNALLTNDLSDDNKFKSWSTFRLKALVVAGTYRKKRCKCLGVDSKPIYLVVKLLQFHTNHRPPYFGTLRIHDKGLIVKSMARRPFSIVKNVDYEYDSDEDWGDDEDILDAESITASEDDDDEKDDVSQDNNSNPNSSDEENPWLVPDGYISDDEGLDDTANTLTARKRPVDNTPMIKRDPRRKYIEKQPVIMGPFIKGNGQMVPNSAFEDIKLTWMLTGHYGMDPFSPADAILDDTIDVINMEEGKRRINFNEETMLPDLANIISENERQSIAKLYEIFIKTHGRVSKRQFELKLNQIAFKKQPSIESGTNVKSVWTLRPEYLKSLTLVNNSMKE